VLEAQALVASEAQALEVSEARAPEVSEAPVPVMSIKYCACHFIICGDKL